MFQKFGNVICVKSYSDDLTFLYLNENAHGRTYLNHIIVDRCSVNKASNYLCKPLKKKQICKNCLLKLLNPISIGDQMIPTMTFVKYSKKIGIGAWIF